MKNLKISFFISLSIIASCASSGIPPEKKEANFFKGKIVYGVSITGDDAGLVKLTQAYTGNPTTVYIHDSIFYVSENSTGGERIARIDLSKKEATIKPEDKTEYEKAGYFSIDDQKEAIAAMMPYHFKTDLEDTGVTERIVGHSCKKYKVLKSSFVNATAVSYVWITKEIFLPPSRFNIETNGIRIISPIPITVPVEGTTLKSQTTESGITVTYTVIELVEGAKPE